MLRHTTAMDLLQEGIDRSVIALWLGHESIETTQIYLDANLELKQRVLDKTTPPKANPDGIDPTTATRPSSRACSPYAYVPLAWPMRAAVSLEHDGT